MKFDCYPRVNPILLPCKSLAYARVQELNVRGSNFIMSVFRNRSLLNLKRFGKEIFYAPFLKTRRNNVLLCPFIHSFTQIIVEFLYIQGIVVFAVRIKYCFQESDFSRTDYMFAVVPNEVGNYEDFKRNSDWGVKCVHEVLLTTWSAQRKAASEMFPPLAFSPLCNTVPLNVAGSSDMTCFYAKAQG